MSILENRNLLNSLYSRLWSHVVSR